MSQFEGSKLTNLHLQSRIPHRYDQRWSILAPFDCYLGKRQKSEINALSAVGSGFWRSRLETLWWPARFYLLSSNDRAGRDFGLNSCCASVGPNPRLAFYGRVRGHVISSQRWNSHCCRVCRCKIFSWLYFKANDRIAIRLSGIKSVHIVDILD